MKKILLTLTAGIISLTAFSQSWKVDATHTKIHFSAQYLVISDVEGEFTKFDGNVASTSSDWTDMKIDATIDVNSLTTNNEMRDEHLKGDDFFNAGQYPTISFRSKSIKQIDKNKYVITGDLKIRDVTKTVNLPLVYGGTVKDPWGNTKAGFKATGKINRKDFGLKYSGAAATGEAVVSDNIDFRIDAVLIKQPN